MTPAPYDLNALYRLKPDVVIEPLIAGWYATGFLMAPLTFALITAKRHRPMLASWLDDPALHAAAVSDPDLLGGPFMDIAIERKAEVENFAQWTDDTLAQPIALADALAQTWTLLGTQATGQGLADLYRLLPKALQGLVELVYTPAGAADIRPIEGLLYCSEYYKPELQQALIRRMSSDQRSFSMSTPRLPEPGQIVLNRPFKDSAYDILARARLHPTPLGTLLHALNTAPSEAQRILPLLDPALPARPEPQPHTDRPGHTRWRYFGHACVLVETADDQAILIDPVIAYESGHTPERYTLADLPERIDYLLITHNHTDHALIETLLSIRWKVATVLVPGHSGSVVDPSLKAFLNALGFTDVRALDSFDSVTNRGLNIQAIPFLGEHADLDVRSKTSWLVDTGDARLMFAADSNNLDPVLYARLRPLIGRLSALFLGMECQGAPMSWLYGPLLAQPPRHDHDQTRRLDGSDAERAWQLVQTLDVDEVLIYAMGLEPWLTYICGIDGSRDSLPLQESRRFIERCHQHGLAARRLYGRDSSDNNPPLPVQDDEETITWTL